MHSRKLQFLFFVFLLQDVSLVHHSSSLMECKNSVLHKKSVPKILVSFFDPMPSLLNLQQSHVPLIHKNWVNAPGFSFEIDQRKGAHLNRTSFDFFMLIQFTRMIYEILILADIHFDKGRIWVWRKLSYFFS